MSAFGGKADVIQGVAECLLIAISGHEDAALLLYGVVQGSIGVMSENSLIKSVLMVTSGFERDEITSYSYQRHRFTSIVFER